MDRFNQDYLQLYTLLPVYTVILHKIQKYLEKRIDRKKHPYYNSARTAPAALLGRLLVVYRLTGKIYPQLPRSVGVGRIIKSLRLAKTRGPSGEVKLGGSL
jgi:hypothetical protein